MYAGDHFLRPEEITPVDILFLLTGRHFRLPGGGWLILGRDESENQKLEGLRQENDMLFFMESRPGPTGILRRAASLPADGLARDVRVAAALVVRYGKKADSREAEVDVFFQGGKNILIAQPQADEQGLEFLP
jgi:hypothetical protein